MTIRRTHLFFTILLLLGLVGFSCSSEDEVIDIPAFLTKYGIRADMTASGLYYDIVNEGTGPKANVTQFVVINVTQFDLENNVVGGTGDSGFPFALEMEDLFPGLQEGLQFLGKGGRATFFIPPELTNGIIVTGALIYGVELVEVYDSLIDYNDGEIEKYLNEEGLTATRTAEGLYYIIENPGEDPKPNSSSTVLVDYHGYFLNGNVFDSSVERGTPSQFSLTGVIDGWELGIPLFGTGGSGKLFVPSYLAYGAQGNTGIPANYPLAFDIELIEVL